MRGFANIDAGIVDEDVDPAKLAADTLDHGRNRRLVGDIGDDGYRADASLAEIGDGCCRLRLVASDDGNVSAGVRQAACHAEPDAAVAAGDDRDLAAEIEEC